MTDYLQYLSSSVLLPTYSTLKVSYLHNGCCLPPIPTFGSRNHRRTKMYILWYQLVYNIHFPVLNTIAIGPLTHNKTQRVFLLTNYLLWLQQEASFMQFPNCSLVQSGALKISPYVAKFSLQGVSVLHSLHSDVSLRLKLWNSKLKFRKRRNFAVRYHFLHNLRQKFLFISC